MKRWIIILLLLRSTTGVAQPYMDTARQAMILRYYKTGVNKVIQTSKEYEQVNQVSTGKITIKTDTIEFKRQGDTLIYLQWTWEDKKKYKWGAYYSLRGQQIRAFGDGFVVQYKYDSSGLLLSSKQTSKSHIQYYTATLDSLGRLDDESSGYDEYYSGEGYNTNRFSRSSKRHYYTKTGQTSYIVHYDQSDSYRSDEQPPYDPYDDETNAFIECYGNSHGGVVPYFRKEFYYYDSGLLKECWIRHYADKIVKNKELFFYDSNGHVRYKIDSVFYGKKEDRNITTVSYDYDPAGKLIRKETLTRYINSERQFGYTEIWQYNEAGSLCERNYIYGKSRSRFLYDYDERGNMTSEIVFANGHLYQEITINYIYAY